MRITQFSAVAHPVQIRCHRASVSTGPSRSSCADRYRWMGSTAHAPCPLAAMSMPEDAAIIFA